MHWIVIASASRARVLHRAPDGTLTVLQAFAQAEDHGAGPRTDPDRRGWRFGRPGAGGASLAARVDSHRREHRRFAAELAALLERSARTGAFRDLTVIGTEPFVGHLRQALGPLTRRRVRGVLGLDLCHVAWADLRDRVDAALRAGPSPTDGCGRPTPRAACDGHGRAPRPGR
ncbi:MULTISPECIES: host attachment protein [Ramlibacter]|uniref:Host attachment protein n=1 Tax=Ramlibacter pinisoli TaxID=2682844 RepID=A0A6N8J1S7_9BURK|nr:MULTISPECIES: host attachment protein [Ramlibacter]MBA2962288.1 host attachment protein [Ramlibacter sp. CGMCC 1.13660]MVQ32230.1 hypothetical protein [Ramlibacter pinisoli]